VSTTTLTTLLFWVASRLVVYEPALQKSTFLEMPATKKGSLSHRLSVGKGVETAKAHPKTHAQREAKEAKLVVAIDPGHGGSARGACSPVTGVCEKKLMLHLALEAKKRIEEIPGVRVLLTRNDDTHLTLYDRSAIAQRKEADLFVSLHANASPKGDQQGYEVFVYPPSSLFGTSVTPLPPDPHSPEFSDWHVRVVLGDLKGQSMRKCSLLYGRLLLKTMKKKLRGRPNRGLKQKGLGVLSTLKIPGVLVEVGFLDHPYEGKLLLEHRFQDKILSTLKRSVLNWLQHPKARKCRRENLHHTEHEAPEQEGPPPTLRQKRRRRKLRKTLRRHNVGKNAPWHVSPKEQNGLLVWRT
jgi:N-acetylmuramoyl-L-alanine amidase